MNQLTANNKTLNGIHLETLPFTNKGLTTIANPFHFQ